MENSIDKFVEVEISALKVGQLLDRPLFIYLKKNERYLQLTKTLTVLDASTLEKLNKVGKVFSNGTGADATFEKLSESIEKVRGLFSSNELTSFERNKKLREATDWLIPHTIMPGTMAFAPLFFFHRTFGVPAASTLLHIFDLSVVEYEDSLKISAVAGVIALWIGYTDEKFIRQFVNTVFVRELGKLLAPNGALDLDLSLAKNTTLREIKEKKVPGIDELDFRFEQIIQKPESSDELCDIILFAKWVSGHKIGDVDRLHNSRVARKIKKYFGLKSFVGINSEIPKGVAA